MSGVGAGCSLAKNAGPRHTSPYWDAQTHSFHTPCVRCGRRGTAEACKECREAEPERYGGAMNARDWQREMSRRERANDTKAPRPRLAKHAAPQELPRVTFPDFALRYFEERERAS